MAFKTFTTEDCLAFMTAFRDKMQSCRKSFNKRLDRLERQTSAQLTVPSSSHPIVHPIIHPSTHPTIHPIVQPTVHPIVQPTVHPTVHLIVRPTVHPSSHPTVRSSSAPNVQPSSLPTVHPSSQPTIHPSSLPSIHRARHPASRHTVHPSVHPTDHPSVQPFIHPTDHHPSIHLVEPVLRTVSTRLIIRPDENMSNRPAARSIVRTIQFTAHPADPVMLIILQLIHPSVRAAYDLSRSSVGRPSPTFRLIVHPTDDPTSLSFIRPIIHPNDDPFILSKPAFRRIIHPTDDPFNQSVGRPSSIASDPSVHPTIFHGIHPTRPLDLTPNSLKSSEEGYSTVHGKGNFPFSAFPGLSIQAFSGITTEDHEGSISKPLLPLRD